MGGGSTSQLCAHCGSELVAGTRSCRICGQSVRGNDADPVPFPNLPGASPSGAAPSPDWAGSGSPNLPGGGLQPRDTAQDTVTAAAIPAIRDNPRPAPPADDQPGGYQPPGYRPPPYQSPGYQSPEYQRAEYQRPDQQATRYQPADYQPPAYQSPGYQPPGYEAPGHQAPPDGGGSRRIIVGVLAVIVAVVGIATGLLIARAHASPGHLAGPGHSTPAQGSGSPGTGSPGSVPPSSSAPSSASASAQQQGADNLSALLSQSVSDRGAINNAYNDVQTCGPTLAQDQATFQQAVTSRQGLLSRLGTMPDAAALPAGMISSLTQAWQASVTADQDFAAWAQDESASCTPGGSDANLSAATVPDDQATQDKTAFVGSWNPIAQQYSLTTYTQAQL
jgi:hypothetical protein